ncbi:hypothetical protein F4813DRAFT_400539 [Daldinia decipiens]|uniref:uncharacterized protein n=1 Tax=Daldinia decipiens TaxID=326647 RepID=UPI0020C54EEE|nr:uncharacterized protein F4813DRAFT_400539 [Daldinia decipiens]KAI1652901.1 hypothetical protein F4813DRAFT_400539 [Daldinia decipiens]
MASYSRQVYVAEDPGGVLCDIEVDEEAMMSPHRIDQGGIPLVCYACEKIPTFSDLSHLITHVSSKAHLLELYNLRIKSYGNEACAAQARKFEIWNQTYNIDQLVRQRMEARDEKGIQPQRRGRRGNANSRGRSRKVPDLTDIKHEPDGDMSFGDGYEDLQGSSIHSWQTNLNPLMPQEGDLDLIPQGNFEDWGDEEDLVKYESSEAESSYPSENLTEVTEVNENDTGSLSLKGVVYPGMGLFDAAKEEQRRKRNQRKPPAVLLQLEINSTMVTTQEDVYDLNLEYQRSRDVYDDPSIDGSELEDEDDVERKPRRRGTQTHATLVSKRAKQRTSSRDIRTTRTTRAAAQAAQRFTSTEDFISPAHSRTLNAGGRIARSASNCGSVSQAQLPLHNHGFQGESSLIHDPLAMDNDLGWVQPPEFAGDTPADIEEQMLPIPPLVDEGDSESLIMSQFAYNGLTYIDSQDRLPGLALRPGNPNLSFASPSPSLKRSSSHFLGKENDSLARKPPVASSNPYLRSMNSTHNENYNPLYVQPQDGLAFRMYDTYEEDVKPVTGFHPVNGHDGFNSLQMQAHHSATYAPNQTGSGDFDI